MKKYRKELILILLVLFGITVVASFALAEPPVRLVPIEEEREINMMIPTLSSDSPARRIIMSEELVWYTDREMPPAYQLQNTFHSPFYNVSNDNEQDLSGRRIGKDRIGNGNRDFPWVTTAGTDLSSDVEVFRFAKFPKDEGGKILPMVHFTGTNPGSGLRAFQGARTTLGEGGGSDSAQRWLYPKGMVFGELLCLQGPDDRLYPFELRMRFREKDYWEVDVFRHYTNPRDLEKQIRSLRPSWWEDDSLVSFVNDLRNPKIVEGTLRDANRDKSAFQARFNKHELRPLKDNQLIAELLTTANWKSAHGLDWVEGVHAPTVAKGTKFHILPEEYSAHVVSVDSESCANCHKHTGFNVRSFDANRGWYGRVRGNDNIISHHPIDPSAISYDGRNKEVKFRNSYVQNGLVEAYNPTRHPSSIYTLLRN